MKKDISFADERCRKLKMGEVPWSITLQSAWDLIQLWSNVVSRKKGTKVRTKFISRLEKGQIPFPFVKYQWRRQTIV